MKTRRLVPGRLAQLRLKAGMTQEDAAHGLRRKGFKATGLSISRWERGTHEPRSNVIPALSEVYGVTIDELYGEDEEEDSETVLQRLAREAADRGDYAAAEDLYGVLHGRAVSAKPTAARRVQAVRA
jgi:transcriptional regulator with XRE-family HTH domain